MITYSHKYSSHPIRCSICRRSIKNQEYIYQTNMFYGVVCSTCQERFKEEDLDFIADLITAYGGYFGKLNRKDFSLDRLCEGIEAGGKDKFLEMQVRLFHNALLYGITPKEVEVMIGKVLQTE